MKLLIKNVNTENYTIENSGIKELYNTDTNTPASEWAREETKNIKTQDSPQMTSSIGYKNKNEKTMCGKICDNSLGYFFNGGNNVESNIINVSLFSSCYAMGHGFSILPENFNKVVALFTARKTIVPNWINCKDEYLIPNIDHPDYQQWNNDCIIYSLFNNSSQQSSLRNITYKDKKWDIINHFFFMSNEEMKELADTNNFNEMYQDAKTFSEDRYVYNLLKDTILSPDAKEILELAKDLIRKSMSMRVLYNENHPEYHLSSWDSSWAQIKPLLKEYFSDDYKNFVKKYKEFENRMREGVYKFGFLKE